MPITCSMGRACIPLANNSQLVPERVFIYSFAGLTGYLRKSAGYSDVLENMEPFSCWHWAFSWDFVDAFGGSSVLPMRWQKLAAALVSR